MQPSTDNGERCSSCERLVEAILTEPTLTNEQRASLVIASLSPTPAPIAEPTYPMLLQGAPILTALPLVHHGDTRYDLPLPTCREDEHAGMLASGPLLFALWRTLNQAHYMRLIHLSDGAIVRLMPGALMSDATDAGRILLDHGWVEQGHRLTLDADGVTGHRLRPTDKAMGYTSLWLLPAGEKWSPVSD